MCFFILNIILTTVLRAKLVYSETEFKINEKCANINETIEKFKKIYPVKLWKQNGFFDERFIEEINPHWLQFEPATRFAHYAFGIAHLVLMVVGLCGNLMVVFMFLKCKGLRTSGNLLVLNLALADGVMMFEIPPFIYNSFFEGPALGERACKIYGFMGGLSGTASIITLTSISLDRFFVIKYPLNRRFNNLRCKICLIVTWTYAITFSSIPLFYTEIGTYTPEGYLTSCSFDYMTPHKKVRYFIFGYFCLAWVIPLCVISFSYFHILRVVKLKMKGKGMDGMKQESFRHVKEEEKNRQDIRLAFVIFFIIILWFLAWTPYALVALLGIFGQHQLITPTVSMLPAMFCKTASMVDPFVYALFHSKFKKELKTLFCGNGSKIRKKEPYRNKKQPVSIEQKTTCYRDDMSDDVEIEYISVGSIYSLSDTVDSKQMSMEFKDMRNNCDDDLSTACKKWLFRPDFSNRTCSLKKITRQLSRQTTSASLEVNKK